MGHHLVYEVNIILCGQCPITYTAFSESTLQGKSVSSNYTMSSHDCTLQSNIWMQTSNTRSARISVQSIDLDVRLPNSTAPLTTLNGIRYQSFCEYRRCYLTHQLFCICTCEIDRHSGIRSFKDKGILTLKQCRFYELYVHQNPTDLNSSSTHSLNVCAKYSVFLLFACTQSRSRFSTFSFTLCVPILNTL